MRNCKEFLQSCPQGKAASLKAFVIKRSKEGENFPSFFLKAVPRKIKMVEVTPEMIKLEKRAMKINVDEQAELLKTPADQTQAHLVTTKGEAFKQKFKPHKKQKHAGHLKTTTSYSHSRAA